MADFSLRDLLFARKSGAAAMQERKRQYSMLLRDLHLKFAVNLGQAVMTACARKLGLMRKGVLLVNTESEMVVVWDYMVYDFRIHGANIVERHQNDPAIDAEPAKMLPAMAAARFSIFRVERIEQAWASISRTSCRAILFLSSTTH